MSDQKDIEKCSSCGHEFSDKLADGTETPRIPCPQCGSTVGARFNYCPNCKCNLHPSCPQCKREVVESDKYCPYCGQDLATPTTTDHQVASPS